MQQFVPFAVVIAATVAIVTSAASILPVILSLGLLGFFVGGPSNEQRQEHIELHEQDNWRHWHRS